VRGAVPPSSPPPPPPVSSSDCYCRLSSLIKVSRG
jgi:hypothetical protein